MSVLYTMPIRLSVFTILLLINTIAWSSNNSSNNDSEHSAKPFSIANIFLEQNFTDGDVEVVIFAKGGDEGFREFKLIAPNGKVVYKFKAPKNNMNIGAREIVVESPEPTDLNLVLNAYPEGTYTFKGKTFSGERFYSTAALIHDIPSPATIIFPAAGDTISRFQLAVMWEAVDGAQSYLVELKNEVTEKSLEVEIPGDQTTFQAPEEWIVAGDEYQVSVFVTNAAGNKTASELNFFISSE